VAFKEVGLITEVPVPAPITRKREQRALKEAVAQAVLADRLGYDHFWTVEHHFLREFSHSSAPESMYPYIAALTENIRIGHGVRLLPFPYNHPVRVAEQTAALDLLCDGRLEFGTGRSIGWDEYMGFGIDPADARPMWEEALEVIVGCWTEEVYEHHGRYFDLPPRHVIPSPLQEPHPPLWVAATGPESHEIAGLKGLGLMSLTMCTPLEEIAKRIAIYRDALTRAQPIGKTVNAKAATMAMTHVAATNAEAIENCRDNFMWYLQAGLQLAGTMVNKRPGFNPPSGFELDVDSGGPVATYEYMLKMMTELDPSVLSFDYLRENRMLICGDPDTVIEQCREYSDTTGLDVLFCNMQTYAIPYEKTRRSIELFAEHVLPEIRRPDDA
jgi:alkanesulfonate monooxygenase SsuD/methylene tetrahydromethanopterin reductase-like flavin-dependent oxidoreductase (luciferase family)